MSETSRGVARALTVLRTINAHPGAGVSRIAQAAGISRPAVYRVVRTLEEAGYLRYDPASESLRLTPLVKQLSAGYDEEAWITEAAGPLLDELQREVIWPTDLFCFFDDTMIMCRTTRRVSPWTFDKVAVGLRIPLLVTACGRAYLAHQQPRDRDLVLERLIPENGRHNQELAAARRMLERVRDDGYAMREVGFMRETNSIAVPVLVDGIARCSIAVTYIASALKPEEVIVRYEPLLRACAANIAAALLQPH
ncbi:helix-turn-helix domain-containing protein [Variovorax sp. RA8]|uniref:helix-turn-helix domain-containing protein n=1 Tax=Variovorax sp. (strain JCM 16519 / RA8) TaxID=662548 RepID=UPI00131905A9|nr:helix-turn-helix domain-containing protein [Variovorax sp. RA8]VTU16396.1 YiaKLMNOPQRS operon repressor [Variovorax sp. RA8]